MPWYKRFYYNNYRRRRRFRKRTGRTIRRRWRKPYKRRNWVRRRRKFRKRKLKKIIVKQFQPKTIKRCKIKGLDCLFQCHAKKIYFNFQLYEHSTVPYHLPGGGGWSAKIYTLEGLYDMFQYCRNWWTAGNHGLPLTRYLGAKFKLYQSDIQDYVFSYSNCFPMIMTMESYNSTQPSMLMMSKRSIKVPSKLTWKRKRPYITVRIKPPSPILNKWYLTHDLASVPLLLTQAAACSFDNYYTSSKWDSTNVNINTLKTSLFTNTNFSNLGTTPYHCKEHAGEKIYLYATDTTDIQIKNKHLIALGNTKDYTAGYAFTDTHHTHQNNWNTFTKDPKMWGNPFHPDYMRTDRHTRLFQSATAWSTIGTQTEETIRNDLTEIDSFWETVRYPPNNDNGEENQCYFKPVYKSEDSWNPPSQPEYINTGYPCWLLLWGYSDFIKRTQKYTNLETSWALVLQTKHTSPIRQIMVPLSDSFTQGYSPFEDSYNPLDNNRWHPSLQMQYEQINLICLCGPGTPKLNGRHTTQAKVEYTFYFKFGGCPPTMSEVEDPGTFPRYPIPNIISGTPAIESPTEPPHTFLYQFDTNKDFITSTAAKRLKKDSQTKRIVFADGAAITPISGSIYQTQETQTSEEEEETIQQQLLQLKQQRQQLKQQLYRITRL
nr:MAG: ORF1 [TTV-like mini virus]